MAHPERYRRTAYHEAGHAVVAVTLGRALKRVTIVEDDESLGRSEGYKVGEWFRPDIELDSRTLRRIQGEIMVGWAGTLAEERVGAPEEELWLGARDDIDGITNLAMYASGSTEEASAYIEWLRLRTAGVLNRWHVWPSVEAVAGALIVEATLSGRRVRELVRTATAALLEKGSVDAR